MSRDTRGTRPVAAYCGHRVAYDRRIATYVPDLLDHEPFQFPGWDGRVWTFLPTALLGVAADVVAISTIAFAKSRKTRYSRREKDVHCKSRKVV
jgi:hypothetical protein